MLLLLLLLQMLQLLLLLLLLLVAKHDDWLLEEHWHLLYAATAGLLRWDSKLAGLAGLPRLALHPLYIKRGQLACLARLLELWLCCELYRRLLGLHLLLLRLLLVR